uniref:Uncharacterized protein n=1 Tax=Kalanchoe fedtschenkoi TaxID=63787 RepID=A0A7N0TXN0_KALFE
MYLMLHGHSTHLQTEIGAYPEMAPEGVKLWTFMRSSFMWKHVMCAARFLNIWQNTFAETSNCNLHRFRESCKFINDL